MSYKYYIYEAKQTVITSDESLLEDVMFFIEDNPGTSFREALKKMDISLARKIVGKKIEGDQFESVVGLDEIEDDDPAWPIRVIILLGLLNDEIEKWVLGYGHDRELTEEEITELEEAYHLEERRSRRKLHIEHEDDFTTKEELFQRVKDRIDEGFEGCFREAVISLGVSWMIPTADGEYEEESLTWDDIQAMSDEYYQWRRN